MVFHLPLMVPAAMKLVANPWAVYGAAKLYGIPRVYRRLLEVNRAYTPKEKQDFIKTSLKKIIRSPTEAYAVIQDSDFYHFLKTAMQHDSVPTVVQAMVRIGLSRSNLGKIVSELERAPVKKVSKLKPPSS